MLCPGLDVKQQLVTRRENRWNNEHRTNVLIPKTVDF